MSEPRDDLDDLMREAAEAWRGAHPSEAELGELAAGGLDRLEEVREHVGICQECAAAVARLEVLQGEEGAEPKPSMAEAEPSWGRFRRRLEDEVGEPFPPGQEEPPRLRVERRPSRFWQVAAALGVVALLGGLTALVLVQRLEFVEDELEAERSRGAGSATELQAAEERFEEVEAELVDTREKWTRATRPQTDVAILQWPTTLRGPGPRDAPELPVAAHVERVVALLEDPSTEARDAYQLVIRDEVGRELASVEDLERTRYGGFVVTFSREAFPGAQRLELVLIGVKAGTEEVLGRYAIRLE